MRKEKKVTRTIGLVCRRKNGRSPENMFRSKHFWGEKKNKTELMDLNEGSVAKTTVDGWLAMGLVGLSTKTTTTKKRFSDNGGQRQKQDIPHSSSDLEGEGSKR